MDAAFFREQYEADARNKSRQTWSDYERWVRVFYEGKRFPPVPGWDARERELLQAAPAADRADLARELAQTGRVLAAEWAKDNSVRKVGTNDLQEWGRAFGDAARDPRRLREALERVRAEVEARCGRSLAQQ